MRIRKNKKRIELKENFENKYRNKGKKIQKITNFD